MADTCQMCRRPAVAYFGPADSVAGRLGGYCAKHQAQLDEHLRREGSPGFPWVLSAAEERARAAKAQAEQERTAARAERNREVVDRALEKAGAWQQKRYARLVRQFERSRFKLTRLIAACTLAEESSDPELVTKAYDYILANQPPQEYSRLLDLAGRLRKLGRFGDAEGLYREALVQKPGDKDSTDRLVEVLRLMDRGADADELVRQYERLIGFRGLLEDAIIHAKQYHSTGRAGRIAPSVLALLDPDEEPQRALWSMTMPIPSGVGFAVRTDRRLLIVQDYEYLRSGTLLQPTVIHQYHERGGDLDRKVFG